MDYSEFRLLRAHFIPTLKSSDDRAIPLEAVGFELVDFIHRSLSQPQAGISGTNLGKILSWARQQASRLRSPADTQAFVDKSIEDRFRQAAEGKAKHYAILAFAAVICEWDCPIKPILGTELTSLLDRAIAKYLAYSAIEEVGPPENERVAELAEFRSRFQEIFSNAQDRLQKVTDDILKHQEQDASARAIVGLHVSDAARSVESMKLSAEQAGAAVARAEQKSIEISNKLEDTDENYKTFVKAIEARYQIEVTRQLWEARAKAGYRAFQWSAVAVALLLAAPCVIAFVWFNDISEALRQSILQTNSAVLSGSAQSQADATLTAAELLVLTINRALVIIFPIALYIWIIRLAVRFNGRSLALADDATMRQAHMDTFYRMASDHTLKDGERNLMLEALYRPAPGQSSDTPDFPNVIELVNKVGKASP
ncbi:hypothetical protein [Rhizobium sp. OAE497]|uniref:hypothetical protein n=1 Tax=Rhizobium sp. OAE497 TaxID=2663796 RepID=UPI0018F385D9